jgi:transposase-like protein
MTPSQQLVEYKIGVPLADYLRDLTERGMSNRSIAAEILARTGVRVSHETVRTWLAELVEAEAS